ncbi:hypothetical protein GCM10027194_01490 [Thalassiella azotivora]
MGERARRAAHGRPATGNTAGVDDRRHDRPVALDGDADAGPGANGPGASDPGATDPRDQTGPGTG